jgi:6-phospho-beta-glucosidase
MKLALIGGGGVRAPEFVRGALALAAQLDLQEVWLMDTNAERLACIAPLCEALAANSGVRLLHTPDLDAALHDAAAIVTTVRVGGDSGRIHDERIALRHGVLGQETTGAGGFAMALRSIPAILHIAERAAALAPDAWLFNFTNPAGLVAQALYDAGFERAIGICDSANHAQHAIAQWAGVPETAVRAEVYGLNHLSWARAAWIDGADVLPAALADNAFLQSTHLRLFDADLVRRRGTFFNEYLWYWYYRDAALAAVRGETQTRGEQIAALNERLFAQLGGALPDALAAFEAYHAERNGTYMAYAGDSHQPSAVSQQLRANSQEPKADTQHPTPTAGYAGVALQTLAALRGGEGIHIALNVANGMALAAVDATDVVEVSCYVDRSGIQPKMIDLLPEDDMLLMQAVKRYERLTVAAVQARSRALAVDALMAHPLVASYPLAKALVAGYLEAHKAYIGDWG